MGIEGVLSADKEECLEVTEVISNSEAERVGLQKGDLIKQYDSVNVGSNIDLFMGMLTKTIGRETVPLVISRAGESISLSVTGGGLGIKIIAPARFSASKKDTAENVASSDFVTLSAYGKFLSVFGWVIVVLGAFGILLGLSSRSLGVIGIVGGAFAAILGIGLVVNGQVVSCFVSIERNTKSSVALLKLLAIKPQ